MATGEANYVIRFTLTEATTIRDLIRARMSIVAEMIQESRGADEPAKSEYGRLEGLSRRFG